MAGKSTKKIDVNTASLADLVAVSGIGESLAEKIIAGRPYAKLKDLVSINGISEKKLESLSGFLKAAPPKKEEPKPVESYQQISSAKPFTKVGDTEAFVFLENRDERHDALMIIAGGFIFGLLLLLLRRSSK
jgi:competence protein ComEA